MEYSLDYKLAADRTGLQPIVDMSAPSNVTKQVTMCVCESTHTAAAVFCQFYCKYSVMCIL